MDLDEIKKNWNALNQELQQQNLTDREYIIHLINQQRKKTNGKLKLMAKLQRMSTIIGITALLSIAIAAAFWENGWEHYTSPAIFAALGLSWGLWWDNRMHRLINSIRTDTMPVAEVCRYMAILSRYTQYEVWITSIWTVIFSGLLYWSLNYWQRPPLQQIWLITALVLADVTIIGTLYYRLIYKHIKDIKQDIEELKHLEQEKQTL